MGEFSVGTNWPPRSQFTNERASERAGVNSAGKTKVKRCGGVQKPNLFDNNLKIIVYRASNVR